MRATPLCRQVFGVLSTVLVATGACAIDDALGAPSRGYAARACGYDLDGDGVAGEADDCRVCDGVTTDVNGDGVTDRLRYVDCASGSDGNGDGTPSSPFRTIRHAMGTLSSPSAGQIQAVCFRNTCSETINPSRSGAAGTRESGGIEYPSYPLLLSGWDTDGDGDYPPHDPDDTAVLDGDDGGSYAFAILNDPARSRLEIAHFTARDYGRACGSEGGFLKPALGGNDASAISVHDVELLDINGGCAAASSRAVFLLFMRGSTLSNFSVSNVLLQNYGGYAARGSGAGTKILGPYRFEHMTVRPKGPSNGYAHGIKLWDYIDGVQVVSNVFDAQPRAWNPCPSSVDVSGCEPVYAITAAQCSQGWKIEDNLFVDWKYAIMLQPDAGSSFCQSRDIDDVVIERNVIRNTWSPWRYGDMGISIRKGDASTVRDVTITNNFLSSGPGWESCIWSNAGKSSGTQHGTIRIAGNTCEGPINRYAGIMVGAPSNEGGEPPVRQQNYTLQNNVVAAVGPGNVNVNTGYGPSGLSANGNVYDPNGGFSWQSDQPGSSDAGGLPGWKSQASEGSKTKACRPDFVDVGAGDLHLKEADTCARGAGVDISALTTVDIDGDRRPQSGVWDSGGDQFATAAAQAPEAPVLLGVVPLK